MGLTYQSTRGGEKEVTASMAILQGLAKDGGLFMPSCIPQLDVPLEMLALSLIHIVHDIPGNSV